ncbi:flavin monoamine oxidase family protein [Flagellimonas sp.]|uniref:flavin monoamine oxidase family protein n=1 Tax=Flagellimonas sp. TaxID=2058762 RepID=UPI003F49C594
MMTRVEFVKMCGLLGVSLPFQTVIKSCSNSSEDPIVKGSFEGTVLIVGAGAAGMAAGYLLQQLGIDYQILEADTSYGGRFRTNNTFTDFPIPLGAEWLHVSESVFSEIVNDSSVQIPKITQGYQATDTYGVFRNGRLNVVELGSDNSFIDQKFIRSSWFDFYDEYIVPSIRDRMQFNTQITSINYSGDTVVASDLNGNAYQANKLALTVPLRLLQLGQIDINPPLPNNKQRAITDANIWSGIKVFLKFSEKFYPTFLEFEDSETSEGQRMYDDVAYAQNSADHVLGLFAVGKQAEVYQSFNEDALKTYILNELDEIFDGKATESFQDILVQNWNEQPFARGAYLTDRASISISRIMSESVNDKLYFAGTSYTQANDWSSVHTAAQSARDAVRELIL